MAEGDGNLRRMIEQVAGPQPRGSGYHINMPDGKGGYGQVAVEVATVMLLDNVATRLGELVGKMDEVLRELRENRAVVLSAEVVGGDE